MKEKKMETITAEERAAHIVDMFHRMTVHHTLWFREVEHQLGFEKALTVMDYAKCGSSSFGGAISFP